MKFEMLRDSKIEPEARAGTVVYALRFYDYGLARDDEAQFGFPCRSVTLDAQGNYPCFVVPVHDLKKLEE